MMTLIIAIIALYMSVYQACNKLFVLDSPHFVATYFTVLLLLLAYAIDSGVSEVIKHVRIV